MKKILPSFSYLFHPIFVPLFGTLLFFHFNDCNFNDQIMWIVLFQIIIITILIPITLFYLLKMVGAIDSIMISNISQRKAPLFFQLLLIVILLQKSIPINRLPELYYFFIGGLISTLILFILVFKSVKASIHMAGFSALTLFTLGLSIHFQKNSLYLLAFLFLMNGVLASSRLEMKAHTMKEIGIGFLIGVIPQMVLYSYWL